MGGTKEVDCIVTSAYLMLTVVQDSSTFVRIEKLLIINFQYINA